MKTTNSMTQEKVQEEIRMIKKYSGMNVYNWVTNQSTQNTLTGIKAANCPICGRTVKIWEVAGKMYGYCDDCVQGFYLE